MAGPGGTEGALDGDAKAVFRSGVVAATPQDGNWQEFVNTNKPGFDSYVELLGFHIDDEFHHRAIDTLLAPNKELLPIGTSYGPFSEGVFVGFAPRADEWIESITDEQAQHVGHVLPDFITAAQANLDLTRHNPQASNVLAIYNDIILNFKN